MQLKSITKIFLVSFIGSVLAISCRPSKMITASSKTAIDKWGKAVLNIESVCDRYNINDIQAYLKGKRKLDSSYSFSDSVNEYKSLRYQVDTVTGTAIFLAEGNNRYLITAKHVVYDKNATARHIMYTQENKFARTHEYFEKLNTPITIRTPLSLFKRNQFNTLEINEVNQDSATRPFKFSNDNLDIAIISLQSTLTYPLRRLLEFDGYIPINISDIDTSESYLIGDDLIAIGYPSFSVIGNYVVKSQSINEQIVLPLVTFGKTAMNDSVLNYFIADVTINPGNSGGPILKDNKLIGIASQQMVVNLLIDNHIELVNVNSQLKSGSPLAKIIKAKYIVQILNKLKEIEMSIKFLKSPSN